MGDSDDEMYDRRRVRDKFKRERSDYQDRYSGSGRGGREDWPDSRDSSGDWGRNSSSRSGDRMTNRGGDGRYSSDRYGNQRRDRYGSPGDRSDMSPPMKRVRNTRQDWEERGNYSSNNFDYPHSGGSWNSLDPHTISHSLNSAVAAATFNSNTSNTTHQSVGPTQPPMMTFKQFLHDQPDGVDDMEAVKKYNDYKTDFKKQQIGDFFTAHKEEECGLTYGQVNFPGQIILFNYLSDFINCSHLLLMCMFSHLSEFFNLLPIQLSSHQYSQNLPYEQNHDHDLNAHSLHSSTLTSHPLTLRFKSNYPKIFSFILYIIQ